MDDSEEGGGWVGRLFVGWLKGGYFGTRLSLSVIVYVYIVNIFACLFACLLLAFDSALLCFFVFFVLFYFFCRFTSSTRVSK